MTRLSPFLFLAFLLFVGCNGATAQPAASTTERGGTAEAAGGASGGSDARESADRTASDPSVAGADTGGESADDPRTPSATQSSRDERELKDIGTRRQGIDWPCFLGPNYDSKSPETGILRDWAGDKLRIVWQKELDTSYGIGSVSKGRYYQFDRVEDPALPRGVGRALLTCLNAETGEEIWRFGYETDYEDLYGYNGGPRCSPVIDGNRVYIFGAEGMLHCLRADDGEVIWKVDTNKDYRVVQNFFGVGSTPIVEGDLLIVMIGGSTPDSLQAPPGQLDLVEPDGSAIVAFDKYTGEERYRIGDDLASYSSLTVATIDDRRWCFAFCRAGLLAFEPATGKIDFHFPWRARVLESVNASVPVVVGNEVFISETYGPGSALLKVSPGEYEVVWQDDSSRRARAMQTHWNTPIHVDGYLYGCSGRNPPDAELRCIEWATGKVQWNMTNDPARARTSLLYVDGHFVCLTEYGKLQLIRVNHDECEIVSELILRRAGESQDVDPIDGQRPRLLRYPCWAAPVLSHGLLYVRGEDRLVCLELIPENG